MHARGFHRSHPHTVARLIRDAALARIALIKGTKRRRLNQFRIYAINITPSALRANLPARSKYRRLVFVPASLKRKKKREEPRSRRFSEKMNMQMTLCLSLHYLSAALALAMASRFSEGNEKEKKTNRNER